MEFRFIVGFENYIEFLLLVFLEFIFIAALGIYIYCAFLIIFYSNSWNLCLSYRVFFLHWASSKKLKYGNIGESTQPRLTFLYFELLRGVPVKKQARKLQDAQAEKLTSLQADKMTS